MLSTYARNAIVLGLLAAVGPFAIDMYLPALPTIAADLDASTAATQMTLMVFFVAFGICQIVYGPVSDMVGRKPPLYFGLAFFTIGSIGCGARAEHRMADLLPLRAGDRRLVGHGHPARDHPRSPHRRRGDAADGAGHAGPQRVADPGAADRQRTDRAVRLARGVRCRDAWSRSLGIVLVAAFLPETRPPADRIKVQHRKACSAASDNSFATGASSASPSSAGSACRASSPSWPARPSSISTISA